jgi:hypothetical protein
MSLKMILQGGPLDGEQQLVQALNTTVGSIIFFSMPHYQSFSSGGTTVIDLGLEVEYKLISQGPPPVPANGDTWDSSWVFGFVPESYTAPPAAITPPVQPPVVSTAFISLAATSTLTAAGLASTGVYMTAETDLDVDGSTSVVWTDSTVTMVAGSTLTVEPEVSEILPPMVATASLNESYSTQVNLLTPEQQGFEGGTTGGWTASTGTLANSTAQHQSGTHCLAGTSTGGGLTFVGPGGGGANMAVPIDPNQTYYFSAWFRAATVARSIYWFIYWYDSSGTYINRTSNNPVLDSTTGWTQITYTTQPLPGSAYCGMQAYASGAAAGEVHYLDTAFMGVASS